MNYDATDGLAAGLIVELSREIEADLTAKGGFRPLLTVLTRMKRNAAVALANLAHVEATETGEIRRYQDVIRLYDETIKSISEIFAAGYDAEFEIEEAEQEEIKKLTGVDGDPDQPPNDGQPAGDA